MVGCDGRADVEKPSGDSRDPLHLPRLRFGRHRHRLRHVGLQLVRRRRGRRCLKPPEGGYNRVCCSMSVVNSSSIACVSVGRVSAIAAR